jgi:hypothetical protein
MCFSYSSHFESVCGFFFSFDVRPLQAHRPHSATSAHSQTTLQMHLLLTMAQNLLYCH